MPLTPAELARRYAFECQHKPKYRQAALQEFRVPERMETKWTEMVSRFVHEITMALASRGRQEW